MQIPTVKFELSEALVHLQALVKELGEGHVRPDDAPKVAVDLGHVLSHICVAWNGRDFSPEDVAKFSQADYDRLANTVPNFQGQRILGEDAYV